MPNADAGTGLPGLQTENTTIGSTLIWLSRRPPHLWRLMALALVTLLSAIALFQNSIVIDGTRYFYLHDDQMISMRYARNLAEGHGWVWNPGERVEGYTNPLWTLIMAAVHLLPLPDAKVTVAVALVNWALAFTVLLLSERILRFFVPRPGLALAALLLPLALCADLLFWSTAGFETTLLTATFLWVLARLLEEGRDRQPRIATYLLMGLLPLIRSDAYYVLASAALLALFTSRNRWQTIRLLGISLIPPLLHLLFRYAYYGDWLPNTYYLKVSGVPGRTRLGFWYLVRFVRSYGVALALGLLGLAVTRDRRHAALLGGLALGGVYVLLVGGDIFGYSRYLAQYVPVLLVLALVTVLEASRRGSLPEFLLLASLSLALFFQTGIYDPRQRLQIGGGDWVVAGVLIERYTHPEATIAVFGAGNTPYFGRRYAIDLLGKSEPYIARLAPHPGGAIGHNKFDPAYSLAQAPDLIVMFTTHEAILARLGVESRNTSDYITAFASAPIFQQEYLPNPISVPGTLRDTTIYLRTSSPELKRGGQWHELPVSR